MLKQSLHFRPPWSAGDTSSQEYQQFKTESEALLSRELGPNSTVSTVSPSFPDPKYKSFITNVHVCHSLDRQSLTTAYPELGKKPLWGSSMDGFACQNG